MKKINFFLCLILTLTSICSWARPGWKVTDKFRLDTVSPELRTPIGVVSTGTKRDGKDLYLATSLRGEIYALTEKSVKIIGHLKDVAKYTKELPIIKAELGQAGICLLKDKKTIITTSLRENGWTMYNSILKWKIIGDYESLELIKEVSFIGDKAAPSHFIGHCVPGPNNTYYIGVGDGKDIEGTHNKILSNGKLLRINENLEGVPGNPFYEKNKPSSTQSMVYAMGLRNPWAIATYKKNVFVADNGVNTDRLLLIEKGRDYPWDRSNDSFTYQNMKTIKPAIGPAAIVFVPPKHKIKELRNHLVVAASHISKLIAYPFKFGVGIIGPPKILLEPKKNKRRHFTGLKLHEDGFLISQFQVREDGKGTVPSPLFKLVYTGKVQKRDDIQGLISGEDVLEKHSCRGCHVVNGVGNDKVAPSLDTLTSRIRERIIDSNYLDELKVAQNRWTNKDQLEKLRAALIQGDGALDKNVIQWVKAKLKHPSFDETKITSAMPDLKLSAQEIDALTKYLVKSSSFEEVEDAKLKKSLKKLDAFAKKDPGMMLGIFLLFGIFIGFLIGRRKNKKRK